MKQRGFVDSSNLSVLLKDWKESDLAKDDETLSLLNEMVEIEGRHRQILALSSDLEEAYHRQIEKKQ